MIILIRSDLINRQSDELTARKLFSAPTGSTQVFDDFYDLIEGLSHTEQHCR